MVTEVITALDAEGGRDMPQTSLQTGHRKHYSPCLEMPGDHQGLLPYLFQRGSPPLTIPLDNGCAIARLAGDASSLGMGLLQ